MSLYVSLVQSDYLFFDLRNNAGKFTHEHAISEDGIEMTFATNYLGKNWRKKLKLLFIQFIWAK